ncbi:MAG: sulfite exporter TauE/SafE family protein [Burkholderiales bacterium]|nr:sulfite exporter TauE/SafE family protein [Burkholderiales bacterium]MDR4518242.1 sulfite exporter TauE/SafE family protein [Nitrosomonas sp.]
MEWGYTLSGLVVGFIVGVTGVGGGSLMTPLLIMVFNIPPATAVGTDLLYAALTKAGGAWVHGRQKTVHWTLVGHLAMGSVPAAIATIIFLSVISVDQEFFSSLITSTLGIALILTAMALLFRQQLTRLGRSHFGFLVEWRDRHILSATVITGVILGVLVTISSVGAGALGMVVLFMLYPRLPAVTLVGSDIAHAVPLTLVAGMGHAYMGSVDYSLLMSLLVGSLPGIYFGSHVSKRIPDRFLRPVLATILILIGVKLIL